MFVVRTEAVMRWEGRSHCHGKELSVPEEVLVDIFYVFQKKFGWQTCVTLTKETGNANVSWNVEQLRLSLSAGRL